MSDKAKQNDRDDLIPAARKRGISKPLQSRKSPKPGGADVRPYSCIPPALLWQMVYTEQICCPSDHQAAAVWPRELLCLLTRTLFLDKLRQDARADADGGRRLSMPECVHAQLFERFGAFHVSERVMCDLVVSLRTFYAEGSHELLSARFIGTFEPVPRAGLDLYLFTLAERYR